MALNLLVRGTGGITLMDDAGDDRGYPARMRIGAGFVGVDVYPAVFRDVGLW